MKAIVYNRYGSPERLQLQDRIQPIPKEHEVLLKVRAASINAWDVDMLRGKPAMISMGGFLPPMYSVLGADVAGVVQSVGANVTRFKVGDEAFGDLCESNFGAYAEYACANENALALKPKSVSFEQAAAAPQAAVMAYKAVCEHADLKQGDKVLINGAGGGVGSYALQLAKSCGAIVTGVDHASKSNLMNQLGADQVMDYRKEDFLKSGHQYDVILDTTARRSVFKIKKVLVPKGKYLVIGGTFLRIGQILLFRDWALKKWDLDMALLMHEPNKNLDKIAILLEKGSLTSSIDKVYHFNQTKEAFHYFETGKYCGKLIIRIHPT